MTRWNGLRLEKVCGRGCEPVHSRLKSLLVADTSAKPCAASRAPTSQVSLWPKRNVRQQLRPEVTGVAADRAPARKRTTDGFRPWSTASSQSSGSLSLKENKK